MAPGHVMEAGAIRLSHAADGSTLQERMIALVRPRTQEYELFEGFTPPFSWLIHRARGRWDFRETPDGTHIRWDFDFELRTLLAWPVVFFLSFFFAAAMRRALRTLVRIDAVEGPLEPVFYGPGLDGVRPEPSGSP